MSPPLSVWVTSLVAVGLASALPLAATSWLATRPTLTARLVPRLILIAAGALLGAAAFHLIPEALVAASPTRVGLLVVLGLIALAALERVVHQLERPSRAAVPHAPLGHRGHLMPLGIASDALHNTIDGALIATAFLSNPSLGLFAGAAIALHELPRELGTFALCVDSGMSPRRAILVNAATGVLALLGAMVVLIVGAGAERFGAVLLPFAAGNFLYLAGAIVASQRRPASAATWQGRALWVAGGVALTAVLSGGH